jgi:hypothetical protein
MSSRHAPKDRENAGDGERKIVHKLARLPGVDMPREDSLTHYALRSLAENWKWHVSYDEHYLASLPTKLKEQLLSYIATYGDEGSDEGLRVLFLDETEVEGANGNSDVKRLDLGNQIGRGISLRLLKRYLGGNSDNSKVLTAGSGGEPSSSTTSEDNQRPPSPPLPPSWEEEADAGDSSRPLPLSKSLQLPRFPALTHLSLAHPDPKNASWATLLALTSHLPTLTHLSLAYWPFPTLTPNSLTTRMLPKVSQGAHQPANMGIEYGGINYYSRADDEDELSEAAGLLKRLANATYCLKWLDLEGCAEWWAALRYEQMDTEDADISDFVSPSRPRTLGPDFNASWRSLEWMGMGAGWLPKEYEENGCSTLCHQKGNCAPSSHFSNKADTPVDAINNPSRSYASWFGTRDGTDDMGEKLRKHRRQQEVKDFLALERVARGTVDWIRGRRRDAGGKWVRFDLRRPDGMGSAYAKVGDMSMEERVQA